MDQDMEGSHAVDRLCWFDRRDGPRTVELLDWTLECGIWTKKEMNTDLICLTEKITD